MPFIQKSVGSEIDFGRDLRELRELRGWSIEELEEATKIHSSIITALEENNFAAIGDPYYAERHVRALVKALDGRVSFFVEKYQKALREFFGESENENKLTFVKKVRRQDLFVISRYFSFLIILPLILLIGWYVYSQAKSISEPPQLEVYSPQNYTTTDSAFATIAGKTDPNASVDINGQNIIVEQDGSFSIAFNLPRGMTELVITAKKRYGGISHISRYITYAAPEGPPQPVVLPGSASTSTATTTIQ